MLPKYVFEHEKTAIVAYFAYVFLIHVSKSVKNMYFCKKWKSKFESITIQ